MITSEVKFVSYNGEWPNLCSGTLIFKIDNITFKWNNCLRSGGHAFYTVEEDVIERGEWKVDFPEDFPDSYSLKAEIIEMINKNVPQGCCGGCI